MIWRMLQYLHEDQPIKAIDLKDATFMLAKAWDNMSPDAIQNCWRKVGFPGVVVEPTQDPFEWDKESIEEGGESSLWRRVDQQYPSLADVSFSQFASLDEDVTTENQMTENDVEREALEAVQAVMHASSQGDKSDSDDDISVIEPTPLGQLLKLTKQSEILLLRWTIWANERENSFPLFQRWRIRFQGCK